MARCAVSVKKSLFCHDFGQFGHSRGFILHFGEGVELEKYDSGFVGEFICNFFAGFVPQKIFDDVALNFRREGNVADNACAAVFAGLAVGHNTVAQPESLRGYVGDVRNVFAGFS